MKTNNFYLTLTAVTGLVVGSAWARARQLDELTAILHKANQTVEDSQAARALRRHQAAAMSNQLDAAPGRSSSAVYGKMAPTGRAKLKNRDAEIKPLATDSMRRDTSIRIILHDSVPHNPSTSSLDTGKWYSFIKSKLH